jgi:hypothetical protein
VSELLEAPNDASARPAEIQGLVDNAINTRLYGWAWNASRPEERVIVELRLGEDTVATTVADRDRHDLAKAGVGDGRHAFELPLRPEWLQRRSELSVVVRTDDGSEAPIALRVRRADVDPNGSVQRVLEATAQAHRQLREELQRIAGRVPGGEQEDAIRTLAAGQAALAEKLETLTLWLLRMDERLALLPAPAGPTLPRRGLDAWQAALCGALCAALLGGAIGTAILLLG